MINWPWLVGLSLIGAALGTKSAIIKPDEVLIGSLAGALIGFLIGAAVRKQRPGKKSRRGKTPR